jgi:hypothetical protein
MQLLGKILGQVIAGCVIVLVVLGTVKLITIWF